MTFTDSLEGSTYNHKLESGKKRSIIENKWPDQNSGMPYEIYKAESNYSYAVPNRYPDFFGYIYYKNLIILFKINLILYQQIIILDKVVMFLVVNPFLNICFIINNKFQKIQEVKTGLQVRVIKFLIKVVVGIY